MMKESFWRLVALQNRFSIGQMSKLHNTSVKTLRYYDEIDLFKPIEVDPENGYRYYSVEQFKLLDIINYLKTLGVPLKDIKKQIANRDLNDFVATLYEHKKITADKIKELEITMKKLTERITEVEQVKNLSEVGIPFLKKIEERTIIQLQEEISSFYDLELSLRELNRQFKGSASIFIGKVGLTISKERLARENFFEYNSIFLILEEVEKDRKRGEVNLTVSLPSGEYACVYFRGGHDSAPHYIKLLNRYVKENKYLIQGDFIIRTIIDQFMSNDEAEFLMEIQVLIGK